MESRLAALDAGIARHRARIEELQAIKERVAAERAAYLESSAEPPSPPAEDAPLQEKAAEALARPVKASPPPEAERVREARPGEEPGEQFWVRFQDRTDAGQPRVLYPWSSGFGSSGPDVRSEETADPK